MRSRSKGPTLKSEVERLRSENAVLKDLLETQYRETDKVRAESEKADDEVLELKLEICTLRHFGTKAEYDLVWSLKRRVDKAEAELLKKRKCANG